MVGAGKIIVVNFIVELPSVYFDLMFASEFSKQNSILI